MGFLFEAAIPLHYLSGHIDEVAFNSAHCQVFLL